MRTIVAAPANILHEKAREVRPEEIGSAELSNLIADMKKLLHKEQNGVAIAAPQVDEPLRLFVVSGVVYAIMKDEEYDEKKYPDRVFINPVIVSRAKKQSIMNEGCLSVRDPETNAVSIWGEVKRAEKVRLEALDETGAKVAIGASGLLAQVFQHECDHLDGILYTDRAERLYEEEPQAA